MRARSIAVTAPLAGRREQPRPRWRALFASARRFAGSTDSAQIHARLDAARIENERRWLEAGGRRWS
jgi:hypothetical protein